MGYGVFRKYPRQRSRVYRTLNWRQPGFFSGYANQGQGILYAGSGFSLQQGASPAVQIGDTILASARTVPGNYTVTQNNDGTLIIASGGDTSRQSGTYILFRRITGTFDGPVPFYINEAAPVWGTGISLPNQSVGNGIASINLAESPYATSPSGDTLSFAITSGALPAGLSLSSAGIISGNYLGPPGTSFFTIGATDLTGTTTVSPNSQITVFAANPIANPTTQDGLIKRHRRPKDWQTLNAKEAAKLLRLDRKRRMRWEIERNPPLVEQPATLEALPALPTAPAQLDPRMIAALMSNRPHSDDERQIQALLAQEWAHFQQLAQQAQEYVK